MAKPVEELTAIELLEDLADVLRYPQWFDTNEGEQYAEAVRPRLLQMAKELGQLNALVGFSRPS
jgi:hypothetical protein